jgi:hypothetical protein
VGAIPGTRNRRNAEKAEVAQRVVIVEVVLEVILSTTGELITENGVSMKESLKPRA